MKIKEFVLIISLVISVLTGSELDSKIAALKKRLIKDGISKSLIEKYFSDPRFQIDKKLREKKKAYSKVNYFDKKRNFWQESTFQRDIKFLITKKELFDKFESKYKSKGLDRFIVVSLLEMESGLGNWQAANPVFNAYVSEYLDEKAPKTRREWFYQLLKISLERERELCDNAGVKDLFELKGSWAGAFGPMQIMPDEYFTYFIDFNEDGKKNPLCVEDCIGSIAEVLIGKGLKNRNNLEKALYKYNPQRDYVKAIIEHAKQLKEKYEKMK
mgnify:CR=1 FL=1